MYMFFFLLIISYTEGCMLMAYWHVNSCLLHRPLHPWGSSDSSLQSASPSQKRTFNMHSPLLQVNSLSTGQAKMKIIDRLKQIKDAFLIIRLIRDDEVSNCVCLCVWLFLNDIYDLHCTFKIIRQTISIAFVKNLISNY